MITDMSIINLHLQKVLDNYAHYKKINYDEINDYIIHDRVIKLKNSNSELYAGDIHYGLDNNYIIFNFDNTPLDNFIFLNSHLSNELEKLFNIINDNLCLINRPFNSSLFDNYDFFIGKDGYFHSSFKVNIKEFDISFYFSTKNIQKNIDGIRDYVNLVFKLKCYKNYFNKTIDDMTTEEKQIIKMIYFK